MRIVLAVLLTVGLSLAPIGAAWAALAHASATAASVTNGSAMADEMPDCPGMAAKPAQDCACCDTKAAPCQNDVCLAKCWKLVGAAATAFQLLEPLSLTFAWMIAGKPPDLPISPLGPPPRS